MTVERERHVHVVGTHGGETHRIGERERLIAIPVNPVRERGRLKTCVGKDLIDERIRQERFHMFCRASGSHGE